MVVATNKEIDIAVLASQLKAPKETSALVTDAEGALVETFRTIESNLADKLRINAREFETLQEHNHWAIKEIEHLHFVIKQLQQHNDWAKSEVEHLNSIIGQLQQNNEWALQEIQYLRSMISDQGKELGKA
jgi:hypothetical protein